MRLRDRLRLSWRALRGVQPDTRRGPPAFMLQLAPCTGCGAMAWALRPAGENGMQVWCQSCGSVRQVRITIGGQPELREIGKEGVL